MEQPISQYNKFGWKTLYIFVSKNNPAIVMTIVICGLAIYGLNTFLPNLQSLSTIIWSIIVLGILVITAAILSGYLEYSHYRIEIYNDFLKIKRGVFIIEEVGVPYKRIVEIKIHRSFSEQITGLANIRITVFRDDDKSTKENESLIILPALTNAIASEIQHSILERTNTNEISIERPTA